MTNKTVTSSALISLLFLSSSAFAELTTEQLKSELSSSEGRVQQTITQGNQKLLDNGYKLDTELKILQAQQEKTRQGIQDIKGLQQQLAKQMQQVTRNAMSTDKNASCPIIEPGLTTPDGKLILGESEWVYIEEANGAFQSRVDTGAATSSISATDIIVFEREGKRWVKFKMPLENGKSLEIEAPFVRYVKIKQASANDTDRRPVVRLTMQLGSLTEKAEFSLKDRSEMDFSLLLGREFIKDVAVVDVAREFVQPKPNATTLVTAKSKTAVEPKAETKAKTKKDDSKKAVSKKSDSSKKKEVKQSESAKQPEPVVSTATEAAPATKATPAKAATPAQDKQ